MKKLWLVMGLVGVLAVPNLQAAWDGTIGISAEPGRIGNGGGGPFRIDVMTSLTTPMDAVVYMGDPFISFCLERNENITLAGNQGYRAVIANSAVAGGVGGGSPDPLSLATAWLYSNFRANPGSYSNTDRDDLQAAIWFLENELGTSKTIGAADGTAYVAAAIAALGSYGVVDDATAQSVNASGAFNVVALNVYSDDGLTHLNQDMLGLVPEPTTIVAGALLLLPFGMSTIRFIRKNRAA